MATAIDGEHFGALMAELDRAVSELIALAGADPDRWTRGRPGKWTAGKHAAHVGIALAVTADAFEQRLPQVLDGTIGPVPRRGLIESLWIWMFVQRRTLPRGARTPSRFVPGPGPDRTETLDRLRRDVERHRAVGTPLSPVQRDRLWIQSPFIARWHYRLAEMIRGHAVHARHHLLQIREL